MIRVGFTGTQRGMTHAQRAQVEWVLTSLGDQVWAHHGDCIGADADFHAICLRLRPWTVAGITGHPPENPIKRAFCDFDEICEPAPYLVRNQDIVVIAERMIATPGEMEEVQRSGTWSTVRAARRGRRPLAIVYPNGLLVTERWSTQQSMFR